MVLIMLEKIKFTYDVAKNQDNLFTPNHTKFDCMIKYNGKQFKFPYQCNTKYMKPTAKDCIYAVIMDAYSFDSCSDIFDFANEFGYDPYEDAKRVKKIYKACERAYNSLHRLFSDAELYKLEEETDFY